MLVGSRIYCCSCIFVFMRACYPVSLSFVSGAGASVHTWVDVKLRIAGQHVAVNIKNPNRAWVRNFGLQQKSTFLPWAGVLKGGLGPIRGVVLDFTFLQSRPECPGMLVLQQLRREI